MAKNLHNIENLFRKALEENEENPSPNVWNGIENKLDKDNVVSLKKKYDLLKKIVFLLVVLLAGLSIYVWKNQYDNSVKPNRDISKINIETRTKKDTLSDASGVATLQTSVDSLTFNKSKNPKRITEYSNKIIDKTIFKSGSIDSRKSLNSLVTKNLSNTSIKKDKIKIKAPDESLLSEASNSSIRKKSKLIKRKSNEVVEYKTTNQIEDEQPGVINPADIQFGNNLSATETLIPKNVKGIKSNASYVLANKESLYHIALAKINLKIQTEKTVVRKPSIKSTNSSRFAITAFYSPDIAFYHYENNDRRNSNNTDFKKSETENYSSTFGTLIDYKISKQWGLQSGITLSTSNFDLESKTIYAQLDNLGGIQYKLASPLGDVFVKPSFSSNPNIGDSLFSKSTTHTLQYIGFPLSVKYNLHKGKFTLNVLGGISANFLTRGQISTELEYGNDNETETTNKIYGLKPFYFSGLAGIGLDYNIYKKFSLSFSPTLRFALSSINRDVTINSFPNSVGLAAGLKIEL